MSQHPQFAEVSPSVGVLDKEALDAAMAADPDAALAMMADLMNATDEELRARARRLAPLLVLDRARSGRSARRGASRPREVPASRGGDLDIDRSMEAIAAARAERRPPSLDDLVARDWGRPALALCVVVDQSGSMSGARLATAAVTAAACAMRAPDEHAVIAFARDARVLKAMDDPAGATTVVDRVLRLRGHGVTGLAGALAAAAEQLGRARAERKVVILLSDCRATDEADPVPIARLLPELLILSPDEDSDAAVELARAVGARQAELAYAGMVPDLLDRWLS
ncbi:MAG: vWA domain-containing protein [Lapillicoccus sp.]